MGDVKAAFLGALLTAVAAIGTIPIDGCGRCTVAEDGSVVCGGQIPIPDGD